ncbi:MAG TPA: hypothetical protein DD670_01875 [Planctomycetaceae bacterium]|nr:hypothetical protein [Planctomycetaceae bacterium]
MLVALLLTVGCLVSAQPEAGPDELASRVQSLIRRLDAPRLEAREAAEKDLTGMGPAILELLPADTTDFSPEVQQRLSRVRQKLEQEAAAAVVATSRVTIPGQRMPLSKAVAEISRRTGNRIVDHRARVVERPADPEVHVAFDNTPFWEALDDVMKQADLTVYPFGDERAIYLVDRSPDAPPFGWKGCSSGPFRFIPSELIARRNTTAADEGALRLNLLVVWEPRLAPIGLTQKLGDIKAFDENGDELPVDGRLGELEIPVNPNATSVRLGVPFVLPSRRVQKIARLTGTLDALVPGPVETFRFDKLLEANETRQRVAGATVTLQRVRGNNHTWEVEIHVRFDEANDALASHRGWIFNNEAFLERPEGVRVENDGFETRMQSRNEIGLVYRFRLEGSPEKCSFIYKTPAKIFSARFPYELENLDLP